MAVDFTRKDPPWVDVPDPENPPAGASKIMASDLNRIEDAVESLATESGAIEVDTSVGTKVTVGGVVVFYDSGWRAVDCLAEGQESSNQAIKRTGDRITFTAQVTLSSGGNTSRPAAIPYGFRPPVGYGSKIVSPQARDVAGLYINSSGTTYLHDRQDGVTAYFTVMWETGDDWPTTLPGSPA